MLLAASLAAHRAAVASKKLSLPAPPAGFTSEQRELLNPLLKRLSTQLQVDAEPQARTALPGCWAAGLNR